MLWNHFSPWLKPLSLGCHKATHFWLTSYFSVHFLVLECFLIPRSFCFNFQIIQCRSTEGFSIRDAYFLMLHLLWEIPSIHMSSWPCIHGQFQTCNLKPSSPSWVSNLYSETLLRHLNISLSGQTIVIFHSQYLLLLPPQLRRQATVLRTCPPRLQARVLSVSHAFTLPFTAQT